MSHRTPEEDLDPPVKKILDGIKEFHQAANAIIESDKYTSQYIRKVNEMQKTLLDLRITLKRL